MKILIIQTQGFLNGSGGTEKIGCFLANNLANNNFEVEIATNENTNGKPLFQLSESIKITNIFNEQIVQKRILNVHNYKGENPIFWFYYKIVKKYKKIYNKALLKKMGGNDELNKFNLYNRSKAWQSFILKSNPHLIITMTISSLLEITFRNKYNIPIINSVNGRPDYDYSDLLWYRSKSEMQLLMDSYKSLSGIQVLFENYKDFLPNTFIGKAITIPNPVFQVNDSEIVNRFEEKEKFKIINVASLVTSCKQQNSAISVFSGLANRYPNWELNFWGIGNDMVLLQNQVNTLGLQDRVFFNGFTDNPIEKLQESDIFIFPSKYEGFPLALVEAMSVGLPCIGFESCSGVNELIEHNTNGFLVKNENEMQDALEALMNNNDLRKQMGVNAHQLVKKYNERDVIIKWIDFINQFTFKS